MNVLLVAVNAKYIHSNLAIYSLKASAGAYEPLVELVEYTINHSFDQIFSGIYQKKPQLLFFSCYIWNRREILEVSACLKKVLPGTVIWAGGPEVSFDAETFLEENPQFDGVMLGEGERTFPRLLQYYVDGMGSLSEIPGIAYRKEAESRDGAAEGREEEGLQKYGNRKPDVCCNPAAEPLKNLDGLPFPYRSLEEFQNRIIYYESSRGCPFSCSYCLSSVDKSVRFRSLELVKRELLWFLERRVAQVKFVDRTFNCSRSRTLELWRFLAEHDNGVTNFHFEISADLIGEEEMAVLKTMRPGLVQLETGVQTVNPNTLEAIRRRADFGRIARRVEEIAEGGNVHQHLDLIAGLPREDYESFGRSFDAVYRLHPQELQLGFLKVLRGTEMHRRAAEYGLIYRDEPPYEVLATNWISCEELLRLKEIEEMVEIYYNSCQFGRTMEALEQIFARPFLLYEALADYYREKNPAGVSCSRQQRFRLLRDFAVTVLERRDLEAKIPYFEELLTFDTYLRENAKHRPEWAPELSVYREKTAEFYRREERERKYLTAGDGRSWKQRTGMTHLEPFAHNVLGSGEEGSFLVLFDYGMRNPLTGNASVFLVQ